MKCLHQWFGVAADTIAGAALVALIFTAMLPYRLSPTLDSLYVTAMQIQVAGPVLAVALGMVSLLGDARARRMGYLAFALAVATFLLTLLTIQPHSTSRW
jgi:hypothetical protein